MEESKNSELKCCVCKHLFNLKNREPIILKCCDETACRECVETRMMKSESKELVIRGQFDCSFCHFYHCAPEDYEKPIKLAPNKHVKKLVEERLKLPQIFCETHRDQFADKFCRKHLALICNDCVIENHLDHAHDCKPVIATNITEFFQQQNPILMSLQGKIIKLNQEVTQFLEHENQYPPSHILRFITVLKMVGIINEDLIEVGKLKLNSRDYDFLWKQVEQPQEQIRPKPQIIQPQPQFIQPQPQIIRLQPQIIQPQPQIIQMPVQAAFKVTPLDCLIDMDKYQAFLMKCFEEKLIELKMIYRGTEHEFTRKSWEDLCVNKGPTLSVIQAASGWIFGGYTSKSWTAVKGQSSHCTEDDKAWIFSFHYLSQFKVKRKQRAIFNCSSLLSAFGNDIVICQSAHKQNLNSSLLGDSYELPEGFKYQPNFYLAGCRKFFVKQLEVFTVTLKQ